MDSNTTHGTSSCLMIILHHAMSNWPISRTKKKWKITRLRMFSRWHFLPRNQSKMHQGTPIVVVNHESRSRYETRAGGQFRFLRRRLLMKFRCCFASSASGKADPSRRMKKRRERYLKKIESTGTALIEQRQGCKETFETRE